MSAICDPCPEPIPPYLQGAFDLTIQRPGHPPRDIGNVIIGTFQTEDETFFGCAADGSEPDTQRAIQVRHTINLIVSADEITCQNLHLWLGGSVVNVAGGQQILLDHIVEREPLVAVATRDLCNGVMLSIVLRRVFLTTPMDLLFQSSAITGNQFTLRASRDPAYPDSPFGYWEISDGDCDAS